MFDVVSKFFFIISIERYDSLCVSTAIEKKRARIVVVAVIVDT